MTRYFEDIAVGARERFGRHVVTREEIVGFAERYDPQPFHLSDEGAEGTIFGRLAASGWLTTAIAMGMLVRHWQASGQQAASVGGMGVDALRWSRPVYPGDVLSCETEVLEAIPSRSKPMGVVRLAITLRNQADEPVLRMETLGMWKRRPPTA
jgi:acyl dehydratase